MKDILKSLTEYTVPVNGQEWEAIASDKRLLAHNRRARFRRTGIYGGLGLLVVSAVLVAIFAWPRQEAPVSESVSKITSEPIPQVSEKTGNSETPVLQQNVAYTTSTVAIPSNATPTSEGPVPTIETDPSITDDVAMPAQHNVSLQPITTSHKPQNNTIDGLRINDIASASAPSTSSHNAIQSEAPATPTTEKNSSSEGEADNQFTLFIPNSFTPNGDGKNDIFYARADFETRDFEMNIFSRTGTCVFTSQHIDQGWDGYQHGTLLPGDAYIYIVRFTDPDGKQHTQKGQILLLDLH